MKESHDEEPLAVGVPMDMLQQAAEYGFDGLIEETSGVVGRSADHGGDDHVHDNSADRAAGCDDAENGAQRVLWHEIDHHRKHHLSIIDEAAVKAGLKFGKMNGCN